MYFHIRRPAFQPSNIGASRITHIYLKNNIPNTFHTHTRRHIHTKKNCLFTNFRNLKKKNELLKEAKEQSHILHACNVSVICIRYTHIHILCLMFPCVNFRYLCICEYRIESEKQCGKSLNDRMNGP